MCLPDADVFRITINPGAIVTFVMEITSSNLPQIYLWEPDFYKDTVNSFTLYQGIIIGFASLLAVFLTVLYMINNSSMIVSAFTMAWVVLGYICIDFGFISKLINSPSGELPIWRACSEIALSLSLLIFLFTYFNLNRWRTKLGYIHHVCLDYMLSDIILYIFLLSIADSGYRPSFFCWHCFIGNVLYFLSREKRI
nr:hypothetical protein [Candidatus Liberibacter solanacearum]